MKTRSLVGVGGNKAESGEELSGFKSWWLALAATALLLIVMYADDLIRKVKSSGLEKMLFGLCKWLVWTGVLLTVALLIFTYCLWPVEIGVFNYDLTGHLTFLVKWRWAIIVAAISSFVVYYGFLVFLSLPKLFDE